MGTFKASSIEPIKWDVQGAPKIDTETGDLAGVWLNGETHAQGTLPEPTPAQVSAYSAGWDEFQAAVREATLTDEGLYDKLRVQVGGLLIGLGFPDELVWGLAPRQFRGLADHVYEELVQGN